jgi:hypothetical protein
MINWTALIVLTLSAAAVTSATPTVNVAVIVNPGTGVLMPADPANSTAYFCNGGHPFMTALCSYQQRIDARGGFTVGRVAGVKQAFSVFAASTKTRATQLATQIPRGDYGNFSAIIVTTPRTLGDALMWASSNAAVGAKLGMGNNTGPCSLLNIGIADTTQFTNPNTSTAWYSQSIGALVPNAFGDSVSKLAQALYAEEKLRTGRALTFTILRGSSSSSQAIATDIYNSVLQSGAGIEWFGSNYVWPDRQTLNGTLQTQDEWDAAIIPWAQQSLADLDVKPDLVFVGGLTTEVNVSRTLLVAWMTAERPWRPLLTLFAGGAVPAVPDELFVDTLFARQWNRAMRGIERDVKDVQGAAEPYVSDPVLDIQAPEVFAREMNRMSGISAAAKADPAALALGALTAIWLQKAIQIGCRDVSSIDECDGRKIGTGLPAVNSPSLFGTIRSVNGQIAVSPFFVSQVSDDLSQTYLSPSGSSNGTMKWSRSWEELSVVVQRKFETSLVFLSVAITVVGSISVMGMYIWVVLLKKRSQRYRDSLLALAGASATSMGVMYCGHAILLFSIRFTNLAADQQLIGFKSTYLGICSVVCIAGTTATVLLLYVLVGSNDAKAVEDGNSFGEKVSHSHVRMSVSKSTTGTLGAMRQLDIRVRMMAAALPTALSVTACAWLMVLSVSSVAVPSVQPGLAVAACIVSWTTAAAALACVFAKTLGETRAILGAVWLTIAQLVPAVIITATASWSRHVLRRIALSNDLVDSQTLLSIGCILFIVVLITFMFVMRVFYKNEASQLETYVLEARARASESIARLMSAVRDFYDVTLLANVSIEKGAPKAYHNVFSVPGQTFQLTPAAARLKLETVVKSQLALTYFLSGATSPIDRTQVEFLLVSSFLVNFIEGNDANERNRKLRRNKDDIIKLVGDIRSYFLIDDDELNLGSVIRNRFLRATDLNAFKEREDPFESMVNEVQAVLPEVKSEVMKLVRQNQWANLAPQHRNYLAYLCERSEQQRININNENSEASNEMSPAMFRTTRTLAHTLHVPETARRPAVFAAFTAPPQKPHAATQNYLHQRAESDVKADPLSGIPDPVIHSQQHA